MFNDFIAVNLKDHNHQNRCVSIKEFIWINITHSNSKKDILHDGKFEVLATVQSTNTYHPVAMLHCKGTVKHLVYGNIKYGSGSQLENPYTEFV